MLVLAAAIVVGYFVASYFNDDGDEPTPTLIVTTTITKP